MTTRLRVVLVKPSKYAPDGVVDRFQTGFMPNATLFHVASLTPAAIGGAAVEVHTVDEYVHTDLAYLRLLQAEAGTTTLLALVGVQSHQFHRALDLAAYAHAHGVEHCVIGGPHPMTCDTSMLQNRGISFALAEAECIWEQILHDATAGALKPVYGAERRWMENLAGPIIQPPSPAELRRYFTPMLGLYPVRGCPYRCNFCSVIKISGRQVRSPSVESTMASLRLAEAGGVDTVMFVSDNFNKFPDAVELLECMVEEKLKLRFFCQCDTQIVKQPAFVELLGRAGCFEMFVGVESFDRNTLKSVNKFHNQPSRYADIISMCSENGIRPHFSNIIGFPGQGEQEIEEHLEVLKELSPTGASFYILTPIPGTEQYDEYRASGVINEPNLDRFDATCVVWEHPRISADRLQDLLYHCYTSYYAHLIRHTTLDEDVLNFAIFNRFMAQQRKHPMSGGVDLVKIDHSEDYLKYRKSMFDYQLVPLPDSLALPAADERFNRTANWRPKAARA